MKRKKPSKGKYVIRELQVRWFCRMCLQKGCAGITMHKRTDYTPPINDILQIVQMTCHTGCKEPDIRLHYDSLSQLVN